MNKLLLSVLILSAPAVQAHHAIDVSAHMPAAIARATSTDYRAYNDPETQVGDGSVPGIVAAPFVDNESVPETDPEPGVGDGMIAD